MQGASEEAAIVSAEPGEIEAVRHPLGSFGVRQVSLVASGVHLALWAMLTIGSSLVLAQPGAESAPGSERYPMIIAIGIALTLVGPLIAVCAWAISHRRVDTQKRQGLLTTLLLFVSGAGLIGATAWVTALMLIDQWIVGS